MGQKNITMCQGTPRSHRVSTMPSIRRASNNIGVFRQHRPSVGREHGRHAQHAHTPLRGCAASQVLQRHDGHLQ
ncbi:hypothetical protein B5X24_HaOG213189 [Helicoverpa armigera]|uniref:Uncharacterized protein n=1 Tax=Helicoverpa armigera TaxID=29058 RepID=A0A2W1BIN1_HELAM|nr:hypothetical protein B5X24_HaOG213189 [Helicoverpa armigera]